MKKRRSITFMVWPIVLGLVGVAVTVSAVPDMTPEQLAAELASAQQEEQEAAKLAQALFEEGRTRWAAKGVRP